MGEKVLITGGSGLIGRRLTRLLLDRGYRVAHLGLTKRTGTVPTFVWKPETHEMDDEALAGVNAVIHLAGASIAGRRWSSSYKKEILSSRVNSTRLLAERLQSHPQVRTVIAASAIGYYGNGNNMGAFTEADGAGDDFLATVVKQWESEVEKTGQPGRRVCMVRTGIVLSRDGGALSKMKMPIQFGVGAPLGSGEQMVSWVHIDDLCNAYIFLLENNLSGPFNVTAPQPVTNKQLTEAIAKKLNRPLWLPAVPGFVLKVILGEMAEAVLTGNAVSSEMIVESGFRFQYNDLDEAVDDLI